MYRFVAIAWDARNVESTSAAHNLKQALRARDVKWETACEGPETLVLHSKDGRGSARAYPLERGCGVVLGKIFDHRQLHDANAAEVRLDEREAEQIVATSGRHLIECYWGSYLALIYDGRNCQHHIFRDPTDSLPCYHLSVAGLNIFASHIEDCARLLRVDFTINRGFLARWLFFGQLPTSETGIDQIKRLRPAERLTLRHGRIDRALLWNPIDLARSSRFEDPAEAARELRHTVQHVVDAWASCYRDIVHKLSGGLDSSIIAACLAHAPSKPRVAYLNLTINLDRQEHLHLPGVDASTAQKLRAIAGQGDETYFARLVTERWPAEFIQRARRNSMDLRRLWNAPLTPSPALYFTSMEIDDIQLELARSWGAQAFFSGQGGDSVLLATSQPIAAIDYAYLRGINSGLWNHVLATSRLSRESVWSVLAKAIRHGVRRRPYTHPIDLLNLPTLVNPELTREFNYLDYYGPLGELAMQSRLPPGKRNHVMGAAGSAYYEFVFFSGNGTDHVNPLDSQPVWELMLQIPTYVALAGGISRGLARQAFSDVLPAEIRKRQVKGTGAAFYQHIVRRNRDFLREHLMDGELVRDRYLDRRKLDAFLAADEPFMIARASSVLSYLAAEIWLRRWNTESTQSWKLLAAVASQRASIATLKIP